MPRYCIQLPVILWILLAFGAGCRPSPPVKHYRIGFSQCGDADHWRKSMLAEMRRELSFYPGIELIYKQADDNSNVQVRQVKELLAQDIDLLIISPNEARPLTPVVEEAYNSGIPVIVVDRKIASAKYTNYIGADNHQLGQMAGEYVAGLLKGHGNVIEVTGLPASSPAIERTQGFKEAIARHPGIRILSTVRGNWVQHKAEEALDHIAATLTRADLVFAHNDVMARGTREASQRAGAAHIKVIGVDALPGKGAGLEMVATRTLTASMLYPTGGTEAIRNAISILQHKALPKETFLQTLVVDSTNVRMMQLQTNKIMAQQQDIERQQQMLAEQIRVYNSQRTMLYILGITLCAAIVFAGLLLYSRHLNRRINRQLALQNEEISRQSLQLIEMSAATAKANEARINFFTNISHEFRTPLTLIITPLEELLHRSRLQGAERQQLSIIRRNAIRLLQLVNQLIDFRKLEFNKMQVKAAAHDLVLFTGDIIESFQPTARQRSIDCRMITTERSLPVWIDAGMMDKVLFNLLSNAFKFTPDNGTILVRLEKKEQCAVISVEDTGIGMTREVLEHAFDIFYQGGYDSHKGSGLGLALCKELVNLHHGTITAASEPHKGAVFTVSIPLGKQHFAPEELCLPTGTPELPETEQRYTADLLPLAGEETTCAGPQQEKGVLLLVEDNPELRSFLKLRLSDAYEILEADNGQKGLQLAFEYLPDAIICDVMMPVKDGNALLKEIKADVRTAHIPVILLTAKSAPEQQVEGWQNKADAYLTKPFDFQVLLHTLTSLLANRSHLKEHFTAAMPPALRTTVSRRNDLHFVSTFTAIVENNIGNEDFSIEDIYKQMNISKVQLYRKVKALMGVNINEYILDTRIRKARYYLQHEDLSVAEVAYKTGFSSPAYFSTVFKSKLGISPTTFKGKR
ncbi:substrate-binding domain-containing protein [uncultured Chitinophaga sp.]|uniref:hybrid sensor histidine kinase/response regulator transcription factor n=1 Tax=uncultured Chitinophaga sp. TaxID=339340 RepID=UPI00261B1C07|nr:substrate-binding domain-containing protein [uncultured Chitinophaga sp.]